MSVAGLVAVLLLTAAGSLLFSTLTYSLRDLTRVRLADFLERHDKSDWLDRTMDRLDDLALVTAVCRMIFNTILVLVALELAVRMRGHTKSAYVLATGLACVVTFFASVAFPHSLAANASAEIVGVFVRPLHGMVFLLAPIMGLMRGIDSLVRNATGTPPVPEAEEIQQEIMSAVEEGEKEGVVDEQEREMIESVIEFRDTTAGQIMTPRPEVAAIELSATLGQVKDAIHKSGHSRIPVYSGTLDQVVGVLHARDLLRFLGDGGTKFDAKSLMRPASYVPETKPLRDLLRDFRSQKVHIAVVLDEYGGTAGIVSIEDVLEELVGEATVEAQNVPAEQFSPVNETTADVDALMEIEEVNRLTGLELPEDGGYSTLGGFVSTTIGRIPEPGTMVEYQGTKFTVLDAEPQRINRVRIEQAAKPAPEPAAADAG